MTLVGAMALFASPSRAQAPPPQATPNQTPAFKNQTRAPQPAKPSQYAVETVASGLSHPWALAFLPGGRMLVTERQGRVRIVDQKGQISDPLTGLPDIRAVAGEGLHDIVLDPQFARNRFVYFTYYAPPKGESGGPFQTQLFQQWLMKPVDERAKTSVGQERVARARLSADEKSLEDVKVILEGADRRLAFAPDGTLFVTASTPAGGGNVPIDDLPQRLNGPFGKVLRINSDGTIPKDNPFVRRSGARPDVYTYGLRDPEGAAINPATGQLWTAEHGVKGGDEINIARPGANNGFPIIAYGTKYSGEKIGDGLTQKAGMEQPVYYWDPDIGPSGMLFYTGSLFPDWKGNLFVGALPGKHLARLVLDGNTVAAEEQLLVDLGKRIRDVRQGPDGALYILTDDDNGQVLRIVPKR
jgi:glucose/arabinose dehydrogenase